MQLRSNVILNLPDEEEIETVAETRSLDPPNLIRKEIHYKNGMVVVFLKDFQGHIYKINIGSDTHPFWMIKNGVLKLRGRSEGS